MAAMTLKQTKVDEITILGPRRTGTLPGAVADAIASGETLTPDQEALIRTEVARFVIGKGEDFDPPPFVRAGLTTGGYMLIRKPVEYTSSDYTEVAPTAILPEPEEDPAVQEMVEQVEAQAEEEQAEAEPEESAKPSRRRSRS